MCSHRYEGPEASGSKAPVQQRMMQQRMHDLIPLGSQPLLELSRIVACSQSRRSVDSLGATPC